MFYSKLKIQEYINGQNKFKVNCIFLCFCRLLRFCVILQGVEIVILQVVEICYFVGCLGYVIL